MSFSLCEAHQQMQRSVAAHSGPRRARRYCKSCLHNTFERVDSVAGCAEVLTYRAWRHSYRLGIKKVPSVKCSASRSMWHWLALQRPWRVQC